MPTLLSQASRVLPRLMPLPISRVASSAVKPSRITPLSTASASSADPTQGISISTASIRLNRCRNRFFISIVPFFCVFDRSFLLIIASAKSFCQWIFVCLSIFSCHICQVSGGFSLPFTKKRFRIENWFSFDDCLLIREKNSLPAQSMSGGCFGRVDYSIVR